MAVTDKTTNTECVSCGKQANPESDRNFCDDCDEHFEKGLDHQADVATRAWLLEEAKSNGDADKVGKIMAEIFVESVAKPIKSKAGNITSTAVKKVSE